MLQGWVQFLFPLPGGFERAHRGCDLAGSPSGCQGTMGTMPAGRCHSGVADSGCCGRCVAPASPIPSLGASVAQNCWSPGTCADSTEAFAGFGGAQSFLLLLATVLLPSPSHFSTSLPFLPPPELQAATQQVTLPRMMPRNSWA